MPDTKQKPDKSKRQVTINGKLEIIPKDNSDGWYGHCEVDFNNLLEETGCAESPAGIRSERRSA